MKPIRCRTLSVGKILATVLICVLSGCGGSKSEPAPEPEAPPTAPEPKVQADPVKAPLLGRPTSSGFLTGKARVQIGAAAALRELRSPGDDNQFLLVLMPVAKNGALVTEDYKIEIDGKKHQPVAVGFGQPGGVYASVAEFVGESVQVVLSQVLQPKHDGRRIQQVDLAPPQIVFLYDVPWTNSPLFVHGEDRISLKPDLTELQTHLKDTVDSMQNLTGVQAVTKADENAVEVEVQQAQRARVEFVDRKSEAMVVEVVVAATSETELRLNRNELGLRGADGSKDRGKVIYIDFGETEYRELAGALLIENERYLDREVIGLEAGAIAVPLAEGETATFKLIFLDPPSSTSLSLKFPGVDMVSVASVDDPIGRFPVPEVLMPESVVRAPMVGTAVAAGYLSGNVDISEDLRNPAVGSPTSADGGKEYLLLQLKADLPGTLVLPDYVVYGENFLRYQPRAVAFGSEPWQFVEGLGFREFSLTAGDKTAATIQKGEVVGWSMKAPMVHLLYEVEKADLLTFVHGTTQFAIENPQAMPSN